MTHKNINPTEWHRKPIHKHDRACPYCGASKMIAMEHLMIPDASGGKPSFMERLRNGTERLIVPKPPKPRQVKKGYHIDTSNRPPIRPHIRKRLEAMAKLASEGKTAWQIAKAMNTTAGAVRDNKRRHAKLWQELLAQAASENTCPTNDLRHRVKIT
jgi:hypothetical protein